MDRGYEKEAFTCLSIKKSIAKKYRRFCKTQGTSQSLTLMAMVEFFEHNGLSPQERLGETIASLKYLVKRRFNALIAILRSIEKEQTLPTMGMIQALFEQELENENEEWENECLHLVQELKEKRYLLYNKLKKKNIIWENLIEGNGLFYLSPLNKIQIDELCN